MIHGGTDGIKGGRIRVKEMGNEMKDEYVHSSLSFSSINHHNTLNTISKLQKCSIVVPLHLRMIDTIAAAGLVKFRRCNASGKCWWV